MPVPAPGEEPENQVEAEEEGRVPAPPAEVPEVPAMPVPAAGEEPENQVEAEEEGRVPAPPAEVPEGGFLRPGAPNVSGSRTVLTSKGYGNQFNAHIVPR